MATRTAEIKALVEPVQEKLGKVESELSRLERERRDGQVQLAEMVRTLTQGTDTLRKETGNLVSALKRPSTRGSWGEIQLRNVVEMAGMISHCDFVEQSTVQSPDGQMRPDMLVRLPGGKLVVVRSMHTCRRWRRAQTLSAKGTSPAMPSRRANTSPNSLRRVISDSSTRHPSSSLCSCPPTASTRRLSGTTRR
jgi:DNA anti-recombination protein RmuC